MVADDARRCALPGCGVLIEDIPGRPPRRYCTAAHRAAARQARRASIHPDQQVRLAATLPWLQEPEQQVPPPVPPPAVEGDASGAAPATRSGPGGPGTPVPPRLGRGAGSPRRRRMIAVLGSAAILAGGYAVTASEPVPPPPPAAVPDQAASGAGSAAEWAARAEIALVSVDRQLDMIAQVEAAWNRTAVYRRAGSTPPAVQALMDRKALLLSRKAALQAQLDSYHALSRTMTEVRLSEQQLRTMEQALAEVPAEGERSPAEASAVALLGEQRDLHIHQLAAQRAAMDSLADNVENATRVPMPADGEQTTAVANQVMEVMHQDGGVDGGGNQDRGPEPAPARPELVGGREQQAGGERQDTATSAPPDPRGPRDESEERRDEPAPRAAGVGNRASASSAQEDERGPVGLVVGAVGGVLTGDAGADGPATPAAPVIPFAHVIPVVSTSPVVSAVPVVPVGGHVEEPAGPAVEDTGAPARPAEATPQTGAGAGVSGSIEDWVGGGVDRPHRGGPDDRVGQDDGSRGGSTGPGAAVDPVAPAETGDDDEVDPVAGTRPAPVAIPSMSVDMDTAVDMVMAMMRWMPRERMAAPAFATVMHEAERACAPAVVGARRGAMRRVVPRPQAIVTPTAVGWSTPPQATGLGPESTPQSVEETVDIAGHDRGASDP